MLTRIKCFDRDNYRLLVETEYDDVNGYHCLSPVVLGHCGRFNGRGKVISYEPTPHKIIRRPRSL